jgi:SAM-dependent methyltransferase
MTSFSEIAPSARYISGQYLEDNPEWHAEDSPWKAQQVLKIIRRNKLEFRTVCEVGCGAGQILVELRDHLPAEYQFFGYEISPQAYELCRPRTGNRLSFFLEDLTAKEDADYDLVLAIDVFEHIPDYIGFLERLRDKGNYKIFHIPLGMSVSSVLRPGRLLESRRTVGHIHYFMAETALAVLEDAGYEVIDYCFTAQSTESKSKSRRIHRALASIPRLVLASINESFASRLLGGFSLLVLTK